MDVVLWISNLISHHNDYENVIKRSNMVANMLCNFDITVQCIVTKRFICRWSEILVFGFKFYTYFENFGISKLSKC